jgi:excisionase family DNA binding protein
MAFATFDVLTVDEVSEWLRIPRSTVYKLCKEGRIPVVKIGKHWRFSRKRLEDWILDSTQNEKGNSDAVRSI